jgi:hypothetical protein
MPRGSPSYSPAFKSRCTMPRSCAHSSASINCLTVRVARCPTLSSIASARSSIPHNRCARCSDGWARRALWLRAGNVPIGRHPARARRSVTPTCCAVTRPICAQSCCFEWLVNNHVCATRLTVDAADRSPNPSAHSGSLSPFPDEALERQANRRDCLWLRWRRAAALCGIREVGELQLRRGRIQQGGRTCLPVQSRAGAPISFFHPGISLKKLSKSRTRFRADACLLSIHENETSIFLPPA